ncbi:hypothetical protein [Paenibacillus donghaensis]|uniref:Uncharacterized protein n=1 Tax=Paenibacillus donghaensis TaxID=414771 RepID=A0A2Z2KTE0_9BACL|nr:hypothetical protein [Paenibacillus donghaensis]ASA22668.1 hypothetical protein B9T62_18850 [Paenibacillus donghaensis]
MTAYNYQNEAEELIEDQDETVHYMQDESWSVKDLSGAVWADGMIHEKEVKISSIEAIADNNIAALEAKIEKLKVWKENSTRNDVNGITFFKTHLHLWHEKLVRSEKEENKELVAKGKKEKKLSQTIKLPYRNLTCRTQQPEITKDEEQLVQWVNTNYSEDIPVSDLEDLIDNIKASDKSGIKLSDLFTLYGEYESKFIKRDIKVAWGELKKNLFISEDKNGKVVYKDDQEREVTAIQLSKQGEKYDWKITE